MRITFIGHAALLVETDGVAILSDPWWSGPCFGAQWWTYPRPAIDTLSTVKLDYIYISHGHHDHCHPGTLKTLPRTAKVLVSSIDDLAPGIRELGFDVHEVKPDEEVQLSSRVRARILPTHQGDTLLTLSDGEEVCVNLNDALHAAPPQVQDDFIGRLRRLFPRIDYLFCGYGVASHFPNCYRIPGKDATATAQRRQKHFNRQWARIVAALEPRFSFPFAADVVFLEDELLWANEPTHNSERPQQALQRDYPGARTEAVDLAPGFQIEAGRILVDARRTPTSLSMIRTQMAAEVDRANRYGAVQWAEVEDVRDLVSQNVQRFAAYFRGCPHDYDCAVRFRNSTCGLIITKHGPDIDVRASQNMDRDAPGAELTVVTRLPYLRWSLTTQYGHEIIFVGSGALFDYRDRSAAAKRIHRELSAMIRPHQGHPVRADSRPTLVGRAKKVVKRVLRMDAPDLYDLDHWTQYAEGEAATPKQS